jgi:hypothetical protein
MVAGQVLAGSPQKKGKKEKEEHPPIAISEVIPYADEAKVSGAPFSSATTQARAEAKCELGVLLSESLADLAGGKGIELVRTPEIEAATGQVLLMQIEGVTGTLGGAITGTKALTVRGELRQGEEVIGSFVARRQQTALASGTCKALRNAAKQIAKDIAGWLRKPV